MQCNTIQQWTTHTCSNTLLSHVVDCDETWDDERVIPDSFCRFLHFTLTIIRVPWFLSQGSRQSGSDLCNQPQSWTPPLPHMSFERAQHSNNIKIPNRKSEKEKKLEEAVSQNENDYVQYEKKNGKWEKRSYLMPFLPKHTHSWQ